MNIEEVVQLGSLRGLLKIKAGQNGSSRLVSWTHIIDTLEVAHFLDGGELLLTSGEIWPAEYKKGEMFLNTLKKRNISGIIFATGHFLNSCPEEAIVFGNKYNIPILEMPFATPFLRVTQIINTDILHQKIQRKSLEEELPINFIEEIKNADSFKQVCNTLSKSLNCSIVLHQIARKSITKQLLSNHHIPLSYIQQKTDSLLKAAGDSNVSTIDLDIDNSSDDSFLNNKWMVLTRNKKVWGVLGIKKDTDFTSGEMRILKHIPFIFSEKFFEFEETRIKQDQSKSELIDLFLEKSEVAPQLIEAKIKGINIKPGKRYSIGQLVCGDFLRFEELLNSQKKIQDLFQHWLSMNHETDGFIHFYNQKIILFFSTNLKEEGFQSKVTLLYEELHESFDKLNAYLIVSESEEKLVNVPQRYQSLYFLIPILKARYIKDEDQHVYFACKYKREILLYQHLDNEGAKNIRDEILPLVFFEESNGFLYDTLKQLTLNNYDRELTAEALFIHRNTLRYRINKIESLLGLSLESPKSRFWLQVFFDLEYF